MENIVKATRYHYQFISLTVRKFVIKVWITSGMKLVIWNSNMGVVLMFLSQEELQDFEYSLELSFEPDNCCS